MTLQNIRMYLPRRLESSKACMFLIAFFHRFKAQNLKHNSSKPLSNHGIHMTESIYHKCLLPSTTDAETFWQPALYDCCFLVFLQLLSFFLSFFLSFSLSPFFRFFLLPFFLLLSSLLSSPFLFMTQ